jgi:hypothetical protein
METGTQNKFYTDLCALSEEVFPRQALTQQALVYE